MKKLKEERLGEISISNEGYKMKIVEYNGKNDIIVEFQDKYKTKVKAEYGQFKKGRVKNPYHKSVYGVGYIGEGKYKVSENGRQTKAYKTWNHMLMRCYDPYYLNKKPTYRDCIVCNEWHCFQNFAKWYEENVYNCNNEKMNLDKDILCRGNKIYSPETCCIIPQRINSLFVKCDASRGKYPIGVYWNKKDNKFRAQCQVLDKNGKSKQEYLGYYDNKYEAFQVYKKFKESYIKQVADEYRNIIPIELYEALYNYEVEIND